MKQKYIDAVAERNLVKVRIMLADELLLDPRGKTFKEMLAYAKQNISNLFEVNKEANFVISPDRSIWDIDLVSEIKQDLISNFSVEKLALFQEVAMEVGKEKAKALAEEEYRERSNSDSTYNARRSSSNGDSSSERNEDSQRESLGNTNGKGKRQSSDNRTMGTISLCGGAALTIVGVCVEGCVAQTLLCLVGGAAVVGGIVLLSKDNTK